MRSEHFQQIQKALTDHPHLVENPEKSLTVDEWQLKSSPYLWNPADKYQNYRLYVDSGYGYLALFRDDICLDISKDMVQGTDPITGHEVFGISEKYSVAKAGIYIKAQEHAPPVQDFRTELTTAQWLDLPHRERQNYFYINPETQDEYDIIALEGHRAMEEICETCGTFNQSIMIGTSDFREPFFCVHCWSLQYGCSYKPFHREVPSPDTEPEPEG